MSESEKATQAKEQMEAAVAALRATNELLVEDSLEDGVIVTAVVYLILVDAEYRIMRQRLEALSKTMGKEPDNQEV